MEWKKHIYRHSPCEDGQDFLATMDTPEEMWENISRLSWLFWYLACCDQDDPGKDGTPRVDRAIEIVVNFFGEKSFERLVPHLANVSRTPSQIREAYENRWFASDANNLGAYFSTLSQTSLGPPGRVRLLSDGLCNLVRDEMPFPGLPGTPWIG
jgi:hypothetical protein